MNRVGLKLLTWDDPRGYGPLEAVEAAYARQRPDVEFRLDWTVQPLNGFESRPLDEVVHEYDLLVVDHPHIMSAAMQRLLLPIDGVENRFVGPSLESYCYDRRLWAVPVDAACHVTAFRRDRLTAAPPTWDDAVAMAADGVRLMLPMAGVHALMVLLTLVASQQDADGDPFVRLTQPALDVALEWLGRLHRLVMPESTSCGPTDALDVLAAGGCDCVLLGFGYAHYGAQGVRFAPPPSFSPHQGGRGVLGGAGMAVSAQTREPELALDFARFCGATRTQTDLWPTAGGQPAHRDAWTQLARVNPFYRDTTSAIDTAALRPRSEQFPELQQSIAAKLHNWLSSGTFDPTPLYPTFDRLHCCVTS